MKKVPIYCTSSPSIASSSSGAVLAAGNNGDGNYTSFEYSSSQNSPWTNPETRLLFTHEQSDKSRKKGKVAFFHDD